MKRIAVFVSGRGTTLDALCEAAGRTMNANVAVVIANRTNIAASAVAKKHGILYVTIPKDERPVKDWSKRLFQWTNSVGQHPDLIALAGFDQKIFVHPEWNGRILNIHPSLLPAFGGKGMYGIHVHRAVLQSDALFSGCTVHVVDNAYDHGLILAQSRVPINSNDTPESLQERIQQMERIVYPRVIESYNG